MEAYMKFSIHDSVRKSKKDCQIGYIMIRDVKVQGTPPSLGQKIFQLQTAIANGYNVEELHDLAQLVGMRGLYKGIDFDKKRYNLVSVENVRNTLQNKQIYYVNSAVTTANYCSIHFLLPFGLYDLDQIKGDIVYGPPTEESYLNISGDILQTDSKLFLSDVDGVFGSVNADSRRTAVTLSTRNVLAVVYADEKIKNDEFNDILTSASEMIILYNGGILEKQEIIQI